MSFGLKKKNEEQNHMMGRKREIISRTCWREDRSTQKQNQRVFSNLEQSTEFSLILPLLSANTAEVHQQRTAQTPSSSQPHLSELQQHLLVFLFRNTSSLLLAFMLIFAFCNLHEVLATLFLLCRRAVVANIVLPDRKALKQESTFRFSALSKCPLKSNLSHINMQESSYMGNWETNQFPVQLHKHLSWHGGLSAGPRQSRQEERTQNHFFGMQQ